MIFVVLCFLVVGVQVLGWILESTYAEIRERREGFELEAVRRGVDARTVAREWHIKQMKGGVLLSLAFLSLLVLSVVGYAAFESAGR